MSALNANYGLLTDDQFSRLSWKQILREMVEGTLPHPPICQTMNFRIVEVEDGRVLQEGQPKDEHQNPDGSIQGGWAFTMLDCVSFCAATTILPVGAGATTVSTQINFTRRITPSSGIIYAEGLVSTQGRRIITCVAKLALSDGKIVAHGTSTVMILN